MNWSHFLTVLAGIYGLYYIIITLFDMATGKRNAAIMEAAHELTFSENIVPTKLTVESGPAEKHDADTRASEPTATQKDNPEMIGSGGVVIDNLFKLCKQEAVIFTRAVSF